MPAKQIISILTLSALIALPVGIAKADDDIIEVNQNSSGVIIETGNTPRNRTYVYPRYPRYPRSLRYRYSPYYRLQRSPYNRLRDSRWRYRNRIKPNVSCKGVGRTSNRTITSRSGNNSTYSSVYTSSCQR